MSGDITYENMALVVIDVAWTFDHGLFVISQGGWEKSRATVLIHDTDSNHGNIESKCLCWSTNSGMSGIV